ncbi:MAG: hypothetical protein ACXW4B_09800 [Micavibrio sp.]
MSLKNVFTKNAEGRRPYAVAFTEAVQCARWLFQNPNMKNLVSALPQAYLRKSFAAALLSAVFIGGTSGAVLSYKLAMKDVRHQEWQALTRKLDESIKNKTTFPEPPPFIPQMKHDFVKAYNNAEFAPYALRGALLAVCLTLTVPAAAMSYRKYRDAAIRPG